MFDVFETTSLEKKQKMKICPNLKQCSLKINNITKNIRNLSKLNIRITKKPIKIVNIFKNFKYNP